MEISRDEGVLLTVIHPNGTESVVSVPVPPPTTIDQLQRDAQTRVLAAINQNLATIAQALLVHNQGNVGSHSIPVHIHTEPTTPPASVSFSDTPIVGVRYESGA